MTRTGNDQIWQKLLAGNQRYATAIMTHPNQSPARRLEVAQSQHPLAVVLSCADSRVPPEIVFDQGLGDLFVVRVAGNIVDDAVLGSIEYAVEHLQVSVVVVLGHQRCGAVDAAVKGGEPGGHIGSLVTAIAPAIERARGRIGDPVTNVVKANVEIVVEQLKSAAPILSGQVKANELKIVGAYYRLDDGHVEVVI